MEYHDKQTHFFLSLVGLLLVYWVTKSVWQSVLLTLAVGVAKEIIDHLRKKNSWPESFRDVVANLAGILLGLLVIFAWQSW